MRGGGYAVLEFEKQRDEAKRLHLVTWDEDGKQVVDSQDIDGDLTKDETLSIVSRNEQFCQAFFDSATTPMNSLLTTFGNAAEQGISDGVGYLEVPEQVRSLASGPSQLMELTSSSNGLALWTIRHALAQPVYPVNPIAAVQSANKELSRLSKQFLAATNAQADADFADHLLALNTIRTHDDLKYRLRSLSDFLAYLDSHSTLPVTSDAYKANVLISTIPLNLLVQHHDANRIYGVTTPPGLMTVWKEGGDGVLLLKGLSVAE